MKSPSYDIIMTYRLKEEPVKKKDDNAIVLLYKGILPVKWSYFVHLSTQLTVVFRRKKKKKAWEKGTVLEEEKKPTK